MSTAVKYALFAAISTLSNIGAQRLSFAVYEGRFAIYIAMFFGTLSGLLIKYVLDKWFVFYYKTKSIRRDLFKFLMYSAMGIVTTIIFWAVELAFNRLFVFAASKYLGAAVGLTVGYTIKYFLDKRFVFVK